MSLAPLTVVLISAAVFVVAFLYSSVGHGGASGYLAVLSFFAVSPLLMSSTALVLNILVAGLGVYNFAKAGHLSLRLALPFLILSVPGALLGGLLEVSDRLYFSLLLVALLAAAYRLGFAPVRSAAEETLRRPPIRISLPTGGAIGVLSGVVGVGGGIFLSPLMILFRWADPKETAAVSALFIVVNSLAGILGRLLRGGMEPVSMLPLIVAAFVGGYFGSHIGARRLSGLVLRRLLAGVLLIASVQLLLRVV